MNHVQSFAARERLLYVFAAFASLLLSGWIAYRETVINPDAICYLVSAQAVGELGVSGAMHLCGQAIWPFYSVVIYAFVQLTHLSYPVAAYCLDGFFTLVSVLAFILIVKALGGSRRVLWLAAGVILLSHQFNSVREYIIRDHGFWAFYLCSLLFLLHYFARPRLITALAWSASLFIATLFRIEGAIFLLVLPLLSWCVVHHSWRQRARSFITLYLPVILAVLAIGLWLLLHPQQTLDKLGRIGEVIQQLQHGLLQMMLRFQQAKSALGQYVLGKEAAGQEGLIFMLALIAWYGIEVTGNLSWIYAALVLYAWQRKTSPFTGSALLVLGAYLVVNVGVTFGFLMEHLFLSKRYLIALSLVLMLWVPFALDDLLQRYASMRHRLFLYAAVLFIFISSLGGVVDFGYSKSYLHQAGDWIASNVPAEAKLYANDYQLMYYSQHFGRDIFAKQRLYTQPGVIAHGQWKHYDYLALRSDKRHMDSLAPVLTEISQLKPVQMFSNKRGDQVVIFKVS